MDHPQIPDQFTNGVAGSFASIISTAIAWISLQNAHIVVAIVASGCAIITACLTGYNQWLAIQEKRKNRNNGNL